MQSSHCRPPQLSDRWPPWSRVHTPQSWWDLCLECTPCTPSQPPWTPPPLLQWSTTTWATPALFLPMTRTLLSISPSPNRKSSQRQSRLIISHILMRRAQNKSGWWPHHLHTATIINVLQPFPLLWQCHSLRHLRLQRFQSFLPACSTHHLGFLHNTWPLHSWVYLPILVYQLFQDWQRIILRHTTESCLQNQKRWREFLSSIFPRNT